MECFYSLVVGDVRDNKAFIDAVFAAKEINERCEGRGRTIISTWSNKKSIAENLISEGVGSFSGIDIIYSDPIPWDMPGNWIRQACLLESGLDSLSDSDWVLKMRTDKTDWITSLITSWQRRHEVDNPSLPLFKKRILVLEALPSEPFFYADMVFGGLAGDLKKIIPVSLAPIARNMIINAEQAFFSAPFFHKSNEWAYRYFASNEGLPHGQSQEDLAKRYRIRLNDPIVLTAIAGSLAVLRDLYWMPTFFSDSSKLNLFKDACLTDQVALNDYFCGSYTPSLPFGRFDHAASNCQVISSLAGIDNLLDARILSSSDNTLRGYIPSLFVA